MVYYPKGYKITDRQLKFCKRYLETFDAVKSAIEAGYAPKTAQQATIHILPKHAVQLYIKDNLAQAVALRNKQDKVDVNRIARNIAKLDTLIESGIPDSGDISIDSAKLALSAIDLQAKIEGHYAPVKNANLNINIDKEQVTEAKALLQRLVSDHTKDH